MIKLKICYILTSSGKSRNTGSCKLQYLITFQKIQECFQMMATFNRLMHEQEARLRHLQSMQIADARARRQLGILEKEYAATKSKSVLKN